MFSNYLSTNFTIKRLVSSNFTKYFCTKINKIKILSTNSIQNHYHKLLCFQKLNKKNIYYFYRSNSKLVDEKKISKKLSSDSLRRLLSLASPERKRLIIGVFLLFISSGVTLILPYGIGHVIDIIYKSSKESIIENLQHFCQILLVVFIFGALANFGRIVILQNSGNHIIKRLREAMFGAVVKQDITFFDKNKIGEIINRLAVDTTLVGNILTMNISDGLRSSLQAVGGISWMIYTCPQLALISLSIIPPVALFSRIYGQFVKNLTKQIQDTLANTSQFAEEKLSNIRSVQAFTHEDRENLEHSAKVNNIYKLSSKDSLTRGIFWAMTGFSGNFIILTVFYYGGVMVSKDLISIGELSSFLIYAAFVGVSFGGISSFYTELMKGLGASSRLFDLLDNKPNISLTDGLIPTKVIKGEINFQNISFTYPLRENYPVLINLDLQLKPGTVTAVVGSSGSGKSTLTNLLLRFYDVNHGLITFDGLDIKKLNPKWLRSQMAIVSQEPVLFSTSISNNIKYGSLDPDSVSSQEIIECAQKANADKFIKSFPKGYETLVGERGIMLSGGQKQRIAIARALIRNPKILLLDEATSALDSESEQLVHEALVRAMQGRTVLVIAHRLSTVKSADQIAVLKGGKICEIATYNELMSIPDGNFRKLVEHQTIEA